jgi:polyhydroxyalkanoate synthesis repressor PhaR
MAKTMEADANGDMPPVIIKKYANRRLYNTESSSYITLDHLAKLTREGREFKVLDAKTDEDITHSVLTQIIMDEEGKGGETMLPASFLRQIISMYGDSMQSMVPQYLEASMDAFRTNQAKFHEALQGAFAGGPFAEIAKRNMAMFEAATSTLSGAIKPTGAKAASSAATAKDDEIAMLKAQLAALQAKVDKLG